MTDNSQRSGFDGQFVLTTGLKQIGSQWQKLVPANFEPHEEPHQCTSNSRQVLTHTVPEIKAVHPKVELTKGRVYGHEFEFRRRETTYE